MDVREEIVARVDKLPLEMQEEVLRFVASLAASTPKGESGAALRLLEAAGEGTILADHFSPTFRPAFPSSAIISERSSPSRVRFAAPNNGAPLTAPGRSEQPFLEEGKANSERLP